MKTNSVTPCRWRGCAAIFGFTLIELLLVLVLLGIVVTISLPNFKSSYATVQLENTANDLSYLMRYAQSRAITRNYTVRLEFDSSFRKYQIAETEDIETEEYRSVPGRWGRPISIPEDITIGSEVSTVNFLPSGEIESASISVCHDQECLVVSTEERGRIEILEQPSSP